MLEKLRDNPRVVVATLVAAGVLAVAVSAGGNNDTPTDTDDTQTAETSMQEGAEASSTEAMSEEERAASQESTEESSEGPAMSDSAAGPVEVSSEGGSLSATVRKGDNQTVIVRQMIADVIEAKSDALSEEQKLYVETSAVNALPRNDVIHPDETISLQESTISQLIDEAKQLDEAAIARWSAYL